MKRHRLNGYEIMESIQEKSKKNKKAVMFLTLIIAVAAFALVLFLVLSLEKRVEVNPEINIQTGGMIYSDPQHTNFYGDSGKTPEGTLRWKIGGYSHTQALIGDTLYLCAGSAPVAVDINAGTAEEEPHLLSDAIADGRSYGWSDPGYMSRDLETGQVIWSNQMRGKNECPCCHRTTPAAILNGILYTGWQSEGYRATIALDARTGKELWRNEEVGGDFAPAVYGDLVIDLGYDDSGCGRICALHAYTGWKIWGSVLEHGSYYSGAPVISDGMIYVPVTKTDRTGSYEKRTYWLQAIDMSTGKEEWSIELGSLDARSPVAADGKVYVVKDSREIQALDAETGERFWSVQDESGIQYAPIMADGIIYFGSRDGRLHALEAGNGTERWWFQTDGHSVHPLAVSNGVVIVGGGGYIYAVE